MAMQQTQYTAYDLTDKNIKECAHKIVNGEIVVFPTETVYGIGASCMNEKAIKQIYEIKKRPNTNPLIMHILNMRGAKLYMNLTNEEEAIVTRLTENFWPGPFTILVKKSNYVPDIVSSGTDWVSLRSPSNTITRKLLEYSMVPIVAPSANMSGKITSTYKDHILKYFRNSNINLLLDNDPTSFGVESTIVKIENNVVSIVRPGIITIKAEGEKKYYVEEGTVEFSNNNLLILTSTARDLANFDKSSINELLQKAEANLNTESTDKDRYIESYKIETLKEISQ